jgi:hypothetical protein
LQLGLDVDTDLRRLAEKINADLGDDLNTRYDEVTWEVSLIEADGAPSQTRVPADLPHLLELAWFTTSLATLAGALGSLTESNLSVREAAYGYHPDSRVEDDEDESG